MAPSTKKPPAIAKTPSSSNKNIKSTPSASGSKQQSLFTFFQKKPSDLSQAEGETEGDDALPPSKPVTKALEKEKINPPAVTSDAVMADNEETPTNPSNNSKRKLVNAIDRMKIKGSSPPLLSSPLAKSSARSREEKKASVRYTEPDSDDEEDDYEAMVKATTGKGRKTKRQRVLESDDEEDEFVVSDGVVEEDDELDDFIVEDDDSDVPISTKKRKRPTNTAPKKAPAAAKASSPAARHSPDDSSTPTASNSHGSSASRFNYTPHQAGEPSAYTPGSKKKLAAFKNGTVGKDRTKKDEERYPWLANVKDKEGNEPGHPDYDPRTLFIPKKAMEAFSAFEKQYWEIKQNLFDTVVFFKKGKFYELYEDDARIGHQFFDLKLTDRVNMSMVGVPESSLSMWASQFIAKGYKIARVDQKETALGKDMRERGEKGKGVPDKVIRRELECVLTAGTLVDENMLQNDMSTYCVAVKEGVCDTGMAFGVCFVDTATGGFSLTEFEDDLDGTKFETLVAQIRPKELVLEKGGLSSKCLRILKTNTDPSTLWTYIKSGREFWTDDTTVRELEGSDYFTSKEGENTWPEALEASKEKPLVMSAFGGLLWYLRSLKIDKDLVSLGNFGWYDPIRKSTSLVLDGQTLQNLEIFSNSFDGGNEGTLFALLNQCITPFGKRTFRQWLCHPLADAVKINARLDAVDSLLEDDTLLRTFVQQLARIPDLERMISRIHAGSCKPIDFLRVLEGFEQISTTMAEITAYSTNSEGVIAQLIAAMPDLDTMLGRWAKAFDREKVRNEGILVPEPFVEDDFDNSQETIEGFEGKLEDLLKKYKKDHRAPNAKFCDSGKEIYLVELAATVKVSSSWQQMSATAKVRRYWPPEVKPLVKSLLEARETHGQIVKDILGRFCTRFDDEYTEWLKAVKIVAQLDCLISLAKATRGLGTPSCRPTFVEEQEGVRSTLEFEELRHPCMIGGEGGFIPNDVMLGGDGKKITLLTGANAAGKSTILRMTCIGVIMAQIGCYVPAASCRMTTVDRIMSRLGANDNIFAAQSTFFVELSETKKILSEATSRSLVILDELGRGTSSYDGVAIAQSVLHHVATHIHCLGFFATHYHSLASEFEHHPEVEPKRMRIKVDDGERRITFLYKLERGVAEKSFGMYCASMCGIDKRIIDRAEEAARRFEHTSKLERRGIEGRETGSGEVRLGWLSDLAWLLKGAEGVETEEKEGVRENVEMSLGVLMRGIEGI